MNKNILKIVTLGLVTGALIAPMTANAQSKATRKIQQRQKTKGEWQKAAYAGGALAILGQFSKDKTLSYVGAAGALYSLYRYDQDSKAQDKYARQRAAFYRQSHYYKNGVRYDRKLVNKGGKKYYTFVKHR